MRRNRRVKIVATLGPASSSPEMIERLFKAGADVFRINMSHTSHEGLRTLHESIRSVEEKANQPIGILVDLQGPKLRLGTFGEEKIQLKKGAAFRFDQDEAPGTTSRIFLPHPVIFDSVEPGQILILDDGKLRMRITDTSASTIDAEVLNNGSLASRKGISLPDTLLRFSALTEKDYADLDEALKLDVDWVALSFVQRGEDVAEARKITAGRVSLMSKIEKPAAIAELDSIIEHSDGIMVARGDLGVEIPVEKVPGLQKKMTRAARKAGKPVVVATQMLESMIESPVPTRAEVSDVSTAVYEGADAIMLSAESAAGQYPEEAVAMMDKVAVEVEQDDIYRTIIDAQRTVPEPTVADAITAAARQVAQTADLAAIICYTASGATGMRAARERPHQPLLALTPIQSTARKMAMVWGVQCVLTSDPKNLDDMVDRACRIAYQEGYAKPGQRVIVSAGVPLGTPGATNMLRVAFVGDDGSNTD